MTKSLTKRLKDKQLEDGFSWLKINIGSGGCIDIAKYNSDDVDFARYYNFYIKFDNLLRKRRLMKYIKDTRRKGKAE